MVPHGSQWRKILCEEAFFHQIFKTSTSIRTIFDPFYQIWHQIFCRFLTCIRACSRTSKDWNFPSFSIETKSWQIPKSWQTNQSYSKTLIMSTKNSSQKFLPKSSSKKITPKKSSKKIPPKIPKLFQKIPPKNLKKLQIISQKIPKILKTSNSPHRN